jgi:hypothetical protein
MIADAISDELLSHGYKTKVLHRDVRQ